MIFSGLVATFAADSRLARSAQQAIRQHPALELGLPTDHRLPLVLETATSSESDALIEWLTALPGIEQVDVVFVQWDDDLTTLPAERPSSPRRQQTSSASPLP